MPSENSYAAEKSRPKTFLTNLRMSAVDELLGCVYMSIFVPDFAVLCAISHNAISVNAISVNVIPRLNRMILDCNSVIKIHNNLTL